MTRRNGTRQPARQGDQRPLDATQRAAVVDALDLTRVAYRRVRDARLTEAAESIRATGAKLRWLLDRDDARRQTNGRHQGDQTRRGK